MKTAAKAKRTSKLDRLLEQGEWFALPKEDGKPACKFVMPTDEMQAELEAELEKKIKKHLKDGGFQRICATRRGLGRRTVEQSHAKKVKAALALRSKGIGIRRIAREVGLGVGR
jgi:hypothetical protein